MGHDDRERKFEQALTRHLRAGAGTGNQANEKASDAAEYRNAIACPDAELLAAFHERMLSSEEMNAAKEHIAGCSRCQEILAMLEASDEIEVRAEAEKVLEMREPVLASSAGYEDEHFAQAVAPAVTVRSAATSKAPRDIASARGARMWRWAAPAGAIAAGLLVWAAVRENQPPTFSPPKNIEVAQQRSLDERPAPMTRAPGQTVHTDGSDQLQRSENRKTRPPEGFGARRLPAETQAQIPKDAAAERGALGGMVSGTAGGRVAASKRERMDEALHEESPAKPAGNVVRQGNVTVAAAPPPAPASAQELKDKKAESLTAMARNEASNVPSAQPRAAGGQPARDSGRDVLSKEKLDAGTAVAPTPPRAKPGAPASAPAKAAAKQGNVAVQKKTADTNGNPAVVATQQAQVTANYERTSSSLKDKTTDLKTILAPGGTVLWRLRATGKIEQSADSGITWSRQNSGTMLELLAGSAPSEVVCWIVGRAGTILRTTDGGGHWSKVVSPIAGDVTEISAVDAMHATIFDASGNVIFATSDGGATWEHAKE